ncbi:hypothetical protein [Dubosiella newyorkensis]|uniref:Glycosyltransferase RgtA/B/C/D-like domain-containing protein n=1 Tax=Dubosiella newyorkensis TaxID=1862672 RepID=A0A1U7NN64_9FIRM|nr:hypothetical protein [Dubosiella newyorkensis]OLU46750.1 hypothetical protein BO225_05235 [Dubosiella newyorkensis]
MKELRINYKSIRLGSFLYLSLPVVLFFIGFVKWNIALPAILFIGWIVFKLGREKEDSRYVTFKINTLLIVIFIFILWAYFGGQGGLFYQTSDWNERNAIFRDLIQFDWPVYYPKTDTMLTYYIGHWLPAAGMGKVINILSSNRVLAFQIGNLFLALWTIIGVLFTYLLMIIYIQPKSKNLKWIILVVFIGFSGMDVIGCILEKWNWQTFMEWMHLEWWSPGYQFSSNTTDLFWVFNQAIPAWVATMLFLNEKSPKHYAFIIGCLLLAATFPAVGLAVLMIGKYIGDLIRVIHSKSQKNFLIETLSVSNIGSVLLLVPTILSYLLMNSAIGKTKENTYVLSDQLHLTSTMKGLIIVMSIVALIGLIYIWIKRREVQKQKSLRFILGSLVLLLLLIGMVITHPETRRIYFVFLTLECGIYWLCLAPDFANRYLYYLIAGTLLVFPMIHIGTSIDFCMRASIPSLIILTTLCAKKICDWIYNGKRFNGIQNASTILLIGFLCIGSITPIVEVGRGIYKATESGTTSLQADQIKSLNKYHETGRTYYNFVSEDYKNKFFYKNYAVLR